MTLRSHSGFSDTQERTAVISYVFFMKDLRFLATFLGNSGLNLMPLIIFVNDFEISNSILKILVQTTCVSA